MARYKVHVWQEQYATVTVNLPVDVEPGSNEAKEIVNKHLEDHAQDASEGVNVHETTGWFLDDQAEWSNC